MISTRYIRVFADPNGLVGRAHGTDIIGPRHFPVFCTISIITDFLT